MVSKMIDEIREILGQDRDVPDESLGDDWDDPQGDHPHPDAAPHNHLPTVKIDTVTTPLSEANERAVRTEIVGQQPDPIPVPWSRPRGHSIGWGCT